MKSWAVYLMAVVGFGIYGAATSVDRDSSGAIVAEGNIGAFNVRVGDCFNDVGFDDEVSSVPGIPCSDPHDNEAYAVFDVSVPSYPEGEGMSELAYESCMDRFAAYVGKDYESSSLEITTMFPSQQSWRENDREVICAVYDMNAQKLTGTTRGSAL
ncbi:MAG: septum formation family protein [Gammaproteobacteria bacterium]|nr:septum formation family protein [Gammaproteobacteria bacterium]